MKKYYFAFLVITLVVVIVIVTAFTQGGSPLIAREEKYDRTRENDLNTIYSQVQSYYLTNKRLPIALTDMTSLGTVKLTDPKTHQPYDYKKISATGFELCAEFVTDTSYLVKSLSYPTKNMSSIHPKGYYCLPFSVSSI